MKQIKFTQTKRGQRAYFYSRALLTAPRWLPIACEDAKLLIATGNGEDVTARADQFIVFKSF